jgi:hypothetical protein
MYYRVMTARTNDHEVVHRAEAPAPLRTEKPTPKPTVKFVKPKSEEKAGGASKVCSVHLGKQLAVGRMDDPTPAVMGKTAPSTTYPSWGSQTRSCWYATTDEIGHHESSQSQEMTGRRKKTSRRR